jgi:hypothetical protein
MREETGGKEEEDKDEKIEEKILGREKKDP